MASTESPRIIIESSILVVTLLFIITQLGTFSDNPLFIGSVAGIGSIFVLAAIFAAITLADMTPPAAHGFFFLSLLFFVLGLFALWTLLLMIGVGFGLGDKFGYASYAIMVIALVAGFLFSRRSARQKPKKQE